MMNFSGENRGYFFVCYTCPEDAKKAIKELNNKEIRPGKPLGVIHSVDNRKLWISGIPKNRSPIEIKADMEKLTDGVKNIILYPSLIDKSKTRGYAFVEYESHRAAALARRKLVPGRIFLCGQEVEKIDWAEPENEVDEETMKTVKILFIRNLMGSTSEDKITNVFNKLSGGQVERVKKSRDYAFVHFTSRESAEKALSGVSSGTGNYLMLDGAEVEVTWSKPVDKYAYNTRKILTKALTTGSNSNCGNSSFLDGVNSQFQLDQVQEGMMNPLFSCGNNNMKWHGSIAPRGRGAAGVKGLGAPGTIPPKNLVRRFIGSNNPGVNGGLLTIIPTDATKYPPNSYDIENATGPLFNSTYYHQQLQNLSSCPIYADQYIKALGDLKLMGGANYYPYSYPNNNIPPNETADLNKTESSNTQSGGSNATSDGNTEETNSPNVVNTMYAPVSLPIQFPPLPGGYAWSNIYHMNPMIAAAYTGQYIPAVCNRGQPFPLNSQNQATTYSPIKPTQETYVVPSNTTIHSSNSHRSSKTRSLLKQVKSH